MSKTSIRTWENRYKSPHFWWVTGAGVGMLRPAPGTWGSALGAVLGYVMLYLGTDHIEMISWTIALTIVSTKAINMIEAKTGIHDAPEIIIDEVAGQWLAILPLISFSMSPGWFLMAFLLFRVFDIIKPWPISWLDKHVAGGFGVMVDDLTAGLAAALCLYGLIWMDLI